MAQARPLSSTADFKLMHYRNLGLMVMSCADYDLWMTLKN